jgi:2-dehydropantoate 2-reductase
MKPVIAIVGAGAVGCYYGGRLAEHGCDVHFLTNTGYEHLRRQGLIVKSPDGDFTIAAGDLHIYRQVSAMPKADWVIVTLKTTANAFFEPLIAPLLKEQTPILTLQNGLGNEEQLGALFGSNRILGGLAFVCSNRMEDGSIRHIDHGEIRLGEFDGPPRARTREIAELFNSSKVRCQVLEDLRHGRWEKLVWNVPFNGLGAALDKTTDKLIATAQGRSLVCRLMLEIIATAAGAGIRLPADLLDRKIKETQTMGAYRTSMQIDKQEGRPMEIEAILHRPLEMARANHIPAPCLQMLYEILAIP